jgi:hypothetical protein
MPAFAEQTFQEVRGAVAPAMTLGKAEGRQHLFQVRHEALHGLGELLPIRRHNPLRLFKTLQYALALALAARFNLPQRFRVAEGRNNRVYRGSFAFDDDKRASDPGFRAA